MAFVGLADAVPFELQRHSQEGKCTLAWMDENHQLPNFPCFFGVRNDRLEAVGSSLKGEMGGNAKK